MFKLTIYKSGYVMQTEKGQINSGNTPSQHNTNITEFPIIAEYEGNEAYKQYWLIEFNRQEENIQNILKAVYPNYLERLETEQLKTPGKLYNIAINKLAKLENKFMNTCSRCEGTGEYSFNQRDGKRCFKCNGLKFTLPKITKKWLNEVEKHFKNTL